MGNDLTYLREPITDKESSCGSNNGVSYALSEMQGWRRSQEDAHIADLFFSTGSRADMKTFMQKEDGDSEDELEPDKEKDGEPGLDKEKDKDDGETDQNKKEDKIKDDPSEDDQKNKDQAKHMDDVKMDTEKQEEKDKEADKNGNLNEDKDIPEKDNLNEKISSATEEKAAAESMSPKDDAQNKITVELEEEGYPTGTMLFGVFDGHGGQGVSKYVAKHLCDVLRSCWTKTKDISISLEEAFLKLDGTLKTQKARKEVRKNAETDKPDIFEVPVDEAKEMMMGNQVGDPDLSFEESDFELWAEGDGRNIALEPFEEADLDDVKMEDEEAPLSAEEVAEAAEVKDDSPVADETKDAPAADEQKAAPPVEADPKEGAMEVEDKQEVAAVADAKKDAPAADAQQDLDQKSSTTTVDKPILRDSAEQEKLPADVTLTTTEESAQDSTQDADSEKKKEEGGQVEEQGEATAEETETDKTEEKVTEATDATEEKPEAEGEEADSPPRQNRTISIKRSMDEKPDKEKAEKEPLEGEEIELSEDSEENGEIPHPGFECVVGIDQENRTYKIDASLLGHDASPEHQGCTANVVVYLPPSDGAPYGTVVCANAGDSRAVLCRGKTALALSEDHKPDDPEETARIEAAGGRVERGVGGDVRVCGDLNLSRSFGDFRYKPEGKDLKDCMITAYPTIKTVVLTKEDKFIAIGCDGIWEKYSNQSLVDFCIAKDIMKIENSKLTELTEAICDGGLAESMAVDDVNFDGTGCDNMTILIARLPYTATEEGASAFAIKKRRLRRFAQAQASKGNKAKKVKRDENATKDLKSVSGKKKMRLARKAGARKTLVKTVKKEMVGAPKKKVLKTVKKGLTAARKKKA